MMETKEFERGEIFSLDKTIQYSEGAVVSKTVTKRAEGTVTLFAFDKNQGLSEHTAPFDAQIHVIDGKAIIYIATTLICGIIFWFLSKMMFQALMGLLLAIILTLNMLGALLVIPSLVLIFKPKFITKHKMPTKA